ncbi:MAG: hypothetical protein HQK97_07460 [Nitrospirae bacterium]|nr:hypothetical protein [Nitrospirota bacterium]
MRRIIAVVAAAMLTFVLVSCGHKGPPTLKEQGQHERKETPPQKPLEELSPYSEDTEHLTTQ